MQKTAFHSAFSILSALHVCLHSANGALAQASERDFDVIEIQITQENREAVLQIIDRVQEHNEDIDWKLVRDSLSATQDNSSVSEAWNNVVGYDCCSGVKNTGDYSSWDLVASTHKLHAENPPWYNGFESDSTWSAISSSNSTESFSVLENYVLEIQSPGGALDQDTLNALNAVVVEKFAFLVEPVPVAGCSGKINVDAWPYNAEAVMWQVAQSISFEKRNYSSKNILILDTGYDPNLVPNSWASARPHVVKKMRGFSQGYSEVDGLNLASNTDDPRPPAGYELGWHGTSVAEVALGTELAHQYRAITQIFPTIAHAGSLRKFGRDYIRLSPASIANALKHSNDNGFPVVNMSFLINEEIPSIRPALQKYGDNVLLVVAAGNDGRDAEQIGSWPAMLGGHRGNAHSGAVLTVGSHEPDGTISYYSRFSDHVVDILAPGCRIPSFKPIDDAESGRVLVKEELSGTSFSAPLVSFTAAVLAGFGLRPLEIKDRINVSATSDNSLENKVYSMGRLNMQDALAFPFVVYRRTGDTGQSRILAEPLGNKQINVTICGETLRLNELAKIARRPKTGSPDQIHLWKWRGADSNPEPQGEVCDRHEDDTVELTLNVAVNGGRMAVTLDELDDFILSLR